MDFVDSIEIHDRGMRRTKDGYLVVTGRVARAGIQKYHGSELGRPELGMVDVFRPHGEVFNLSSMSSFAHKPVTDDHPNGQVTDKDQSLWRGFSSDKVARDGDWLSVPMMLTDAAVADKVESGEKREMSAGYSAEMDWTPGVTPSGLHYDAIQRNIRANHIALVDRARAGHEARIVDENTLIPKDYAVRLHELNERESSTRKLAGTPKEGRNMADNRTVVVDGLTVETTQQGAEVINKLQGLLADSKTSLVTAQTAHDAALAAKDAELATKDAKIAELEKAKMSDADFDKAIAERADLIATAKSIKDGEYKGSPADIRKAAVVAVLGDEAIKDKSEAYVDARFDILAEDAVKADPVRKQLADGKKHEVVDSQTAYDERIANAWKNKENTNG